MQHEKKKKKISTIIQQNGATAKLNHQKLLQHQNQLEKKNVKLLLFGEKKKLGKELMQ